MKRNKRGMEVMWRDRVRVGVVCNIWNIWKGKD
jgi:hypothetical protein